VAQGLTHLHSLRILHRDLKPANIFRQAGEGGFDGGVVIGDLGLGGGPCTSLIQLAHKLETTRFQPLKLRCTKLKKQRRRVARRSWFFRIRFQMQLVPLHLGRVLGAHSDFAKTGVGTPLYFSPELCQERPYNDKSDVWAFGCLVFELVAGVPPFTAQNQVALAQKIVNSPAPRLPQHVGAELSFLVGKMLTKDPEKRPSIADVLGLSCVKARVERAALRGEVAEEERAMRRRYGALEAELRGGVAAGLYNLNPVAP
jgi:serine/threonine protein kinase